MTGPQIFGMLLVLGALLAIPAFGIAAVPKGPSDWLRSLIAKWSAVSGLEPKLIYGVVMTESSGNPEAKNPSDPSAGLMQVTPLIGRAFAGLEGTDEEVLRALMNVETNMQAGAGFLKHLQSRYATKYALREWVQAYNLGETFFDQGRRNPSYGDKVVDHMKGWV
jgi:soluble lytic murein transglycosylase-like protein